MTTKKGRPRTRANGEGTIYQKAPGSWVAQVTDPDGKRRSKTLPTQRKAREWVTGQKSEMDTGVWIDPSMMPLSVWWDSWVLNYKSRSVTEKTRETYATAKARLPKTLLDKAIGQITHDDIQAAITAVPGKRRTAELTLVNLKMCLSKAVLSGKIKQNPCFGIELPLDDRDGGIALTDPEYDQLMVLLTRPVRITIGGQVDQNDQQTQVLRDCLYFIVKTGCRREEGTQVRWEDIAGNMIHILGTKTKASDRWIPIPSSLRPMLDRRRAVRSSEYIFPTRTGRALQGRNLYRWMELNTPTHSVHDLRHTYCTRAARADINPKVLQLMTGHARVETLLRYYTHASIEDLIRAATKIDGYCNSTANETANDKVPENIKIPETLLPQGLVAGGYYRT